MHTCSSYLSNFWPAVCGYVIHTAPGFAKDRQRYGIHGDSAGHCVNIEALFWSCLLDMAHHRRHHIPQPAEALPAPAALQEM